MAPKPHKYSNATKEEKAKVESLAGIGLPAEQIATIMECGECTIQKYFKTELKRGIAIANAKVAGWAFGAASKGNTAMIIFLCKTRLQWREKTDQDLETKEEKKTIILQAEDKPERLKEDG